MVPAYHAVSLVIPRQCAPTSPQPGISRDGRDACGRYASAMTPTKRKVTRTIVVLAAMTIPFVVLETATAQSSFPGLIGKIEFKPNDYTGADSYWYDTDGIDPGVAGCHIGVESAT